MSNAARRLPAVRLPAVRLPAVRLLAASLFALGIASLAGCGEEESHDHEAEDFDSLADCEAHYEEEGRSADDIADLCEGLE